MTLSVLSDVLWFDSSPNPLLTLLLLLSRGGRLLDDDPAAPPDGEVTACPPDDVDRSSSRFGWSTADDGGVADADLDCDNFDGSRDDVVALRLVCPPPALPVWSTTPVLLVGVDSEGWPP